MFSSLICAFETTLSPLVSIAILWMPSLSTLFSLVDVCFPDEMLTVNIWGFLFMLELYFWPYDF